MRILVLSYAYLPNVGGLEQVASMVTDGLLAKGHDVTVITHDVRPADLTYPVLRRPTPSATLHACRAADVVLCHNATLAYGWGPLLTRTPVVCVSHGDYGFIGSSPRARALRFLLRRARRYAVSQFVARRVPQPCGLMPNPVRFPLAPNPSEGEGLLFVGRLVRGKGLHVLLEALTDARLTAVSLTVVGDGPERQSLERQASDLGLLSRVRFVGPLGAVELREVMDRSALLVVPSTDTEGFPMVVLEALARGLGVIASDMGGLPEAVGSSGLVVPVGDSKALADAVCQAVGQPALRRQWFEAARERLEAHTPEAVISRYEMALAQTCGQP